MKNQVKKIQRLARKKDTTELKNFVQENAKELNKRFKILESQDKFKYENESAYYFAKRETGKDKPRYPTRMTTLNKMDKDELKELAYSINEKLMSRTSTIEGLEQLGKLRLSTSKEAIENYFKSRTKTLFEIDEEEFQNFINDGGGELLNTYDSYQVLEDWMKWKKQDVTDKQFLKEYKKKKYLNKKGMLDKGKLNRGFKTLVSKKKSRSRKK